MRRAEHIRYETVQGFGVYGVGGASMLDWLTGRRMIPIFEGTALPSIELNCTQLLFDRS